jgi:hypothetical protein
MGGRRAGGNATRECGENAERVVFHDLSIRAGIQAIEKETGTPGG